MDYEAKLKEAEDQLIKQKEEHEKLRQTLEQNLKAAEFGKEQIQTLLNVERSKITQLQLERDQATSKLKLSNDHVTRLEAELNTRPSTDEIQKHKDATTQLQTTLEQERLKHTQELSSVKSGNFFSDYSKT